MAKDYESEVFEIKTAVRHRVPQLLCIYGTQFSGKTFGAFMVASGLVKPGGKVGFVDTENGRGSAYADDPDVIKALPQGYSVIELDPPFHPGRYIDALAQFQRAGFDLVIIDSASHAWEGEGGAQDMKEKEKGWKGPKLWSKRLKFAMVYSSMDIIVCLRAQEKTKILGAGKDQQYIPLGILPICEKSLPFDLGTSIRVEGSIDGKPASHLAIPDKWPKGMNWLFGKWEPQLLTPEIGRRIREWNDTGIAPERGALVRKQARATAEQGMTAYAAFFKALAKTDQKLLADTDHAANKAIAEAADTELRAGMVEEIEAMRDEFTPDRFRQFLGYERVSDVPVSELAAAIDRLKGALA